MCRPSWTASAVLASMLAVACSPALDWREARAKEAGIAVLFPCRPAVQSRDIRLVEKSVPLTLYVCSAAEVTWAVAFADVGDPALVGAALAELLSAARRNVDGESRSRAEFLVSGSTPNGGSMRERIAGRMPDGRTVVEHAGVFARATWVIQVTALGAGLPEDAVTTFFDSVRVQP